MENHATRVTDRFQRGKCTARYRITIPLASCFARSEIS